MAGWGLGGAQAVLSCAPRRVKSGWRVVFKVPDSDTCAGRLPDTEPSLSLSISLSIAIYLSLPLSHSLSHSLTHSHTMSPFLSPSLPLCGRLQAARAGGVQVSAALGAEPCAG